MALQCRYLVSSDAEQIVALESKIFSEPWSQPMIAAELELTRSLNLGIAPTDAPAELLGYALFRTATPSAELNRLAIADRSRRRGAGTRLLQFAHRSLVNAGIEECFLEVRTSNRAALALYERLGYRQVGLRSRYYSDGSDALILKAVLSTAGP